MTRENPAGGGGGGGTSASEPLLNSSNRCKIHISHNSKTSKWPSRLFNHGATSSYALTCMRISQKTIRKSDLYIQNQIAQNPDETGLFLATFYFASRTDGVVRAEASRAVPLACVHSFDWAQTAEKGGRAN